LRKLKEQSDLRTLKEAEQFEKRWDLRDRTVSRDSEDAKNPKYS
jgi:hypothetical protein